MAILPTVKRINAGKFKDQCLKIMDTVAQTKSPVVVTKRGRPMVKVVPYTEPATTARNLVGSILKETGNPYGTDEKWDAELP
jgi:prevent-host-death family protein